MRVNREGGIQGFSLWNLRMTIENIKNRTAHVLTITHPLQKTQRNYSIDTFRLVAIYFVILHHVQVFRFSYMAHYPNTLLMFLYYIPEMVRLLPFFFIAAGYFFHKGILNGEPVGKRLFSGCKRLMRSEERRV